MARRIRRYLRRVLSDRKIEKLAAEVVRVLREARRAQGWSMNAVAERAGLSPQMVSYVERELRTPTLATYFRLCHALDLDPVEVMRQARQGK